MASNIDARTLQPGVFGVSHGSGITGQLIRHATESWAGHAFIYVGSGSIVEAVPPVARISPATTYDDAIWAYKMPMTDKQRELAVGRAHALVGMTYDLPAYVGFALEVMGIRSGKSMDKFFKEDKWRVCSALVDDCLTFAGVVLDWWSLKLKPGQGPNLVSPAMLEDLATMKGWLLWRSHSARVDHRRKCCHASIG